jgi:hypothetical protein
MSKPTVPDLKELFKQASEIAQQVPENMQEAAFNRAIDLLSGTGASKASSSQGTSSTTKTKTATKKKTKSTKTPTDDNSAVGDLMSLIDSTQHPGVTSATSILDRALMVLQIALRDHDIDGLTPGDIAGVLTEKFRISTRNAPVSNALGLATTLVNRTQQGAGYLYKIMAPGEEHLAHYNQNPNEKAPTSKKGKPAKRAPKAKKAKPKVSAPKAKSKTKVKKATSKVSPTSAIKDLIDGGFFVEAKSGPEVQVHLKSKRGFNFEADHLRMTMLRLVRSGKLERDENAEGQYEYKSPKP